MYIRTSFVCSSLRVSSIRIYILITGFVDPKCNREGVCLSACWDARPPRPGRPHPPGPAGRSPWTRQGEPPWTRQTPLDQGEPLQTRQTPPGPGRPPRTRQTPPDQADPPGKQTSAYGQRAAGTHPTGIHSCFW